MPNTVTCTISNGTGDTLTLDASATTPNDGTWTTAPPAQCGASASFTCAGSASGARGTAKYDGPNGSLVLSFNNPPTGSNDFSASATGSYDAGYSASQGRDASVTYMVQKKSTGDGDRDGIPSSVDQDPPPDDHSKQAHVPLKAKAPMVLSVKAWLIDIAWEAVNHLEWDPYILEITENRHGIMSSTPGKRGASCPGTLPDFTKYGIKKNGPCDNAHDYFYSWCGDYVSWVFWKGFVLKQDAKQTVNVTQQDLGKIFNREALNGTWVEGQNLNMVENYAKGSGNLLVWHNPGDGFMPQRGDIYLLNRADGGHIGIIDSFDPTPKGRNKYYEYVTLDGKSFDYPDIAHHDPGWNAALQKHPSSELKGMEMHQQGVVQNFRSTDKGETVRGFVDASKLRQALGYR